ncbi:hypothetical protein ACH5RR_032157 [Cinchona calisaya]|uniref:DUF309 domain-containing protein n=1 Tax=Cinchona calisaya TaxID=153742 RepID=A0ABD2YKR0_9GENT
MDVLSSFLPSFVGSSSSVSSRIKRTVYPSTIQNFCSFSFFKSKPHSQLKEVELSDHKSASYRHSSWRRFTEEEQDVDCCNFQDAVELFNNREYYSCHDVLEALWNKSQEPTRTLLHAILQCAVGFHHLFNQNHRGAMMELGEGLCKLRKMNFESGPFYEFEKDISTVLDFIYQTQLELAACTEDLCLTINQSERSYQLLGSYAANQPLYRVETTNQENYSFIVFCPERFHATSEQIRIKLPFLQASEDHLMNLGAKY